VAVEDDVVLVAAVVELADVGVKTADPTCAGATDVVIVTAALEAAGLAVDVAVTGAVLVDVVAVNAVLDTVGVAVTFST